ncbi:MAG: DUF6514 family protein [Acutalibacteraceae bacterium]
MVRYFLKQTEIDFFDKKVITYGIAVKSDNKIIREIDDICLDKDKLSKLINLCNSEELCEIHLDEVIENFLQNNESF